LFTLLAVIFMVATYSTSAEAVLKAFGPLNFAGFPAYYQDINNLAVQQCLSQAVSPVTGLPICGLLAFPGTVPPFDPTLPVTFPPNPPTGFNFPLESFYLSAQPPPAFKNLAPGAGKVLILTNLEGSFANNINPVVGDQIVFSRVRIWLLGASTGRYKITHPYGVDFMDVIQADIKTQKFTRDIGLVGIRFTGALLGDVGPFVHWTPDAPLLLGQNADGSLNATNPLTGAAEVFLGDPNIPHPFTGSPFGTNFWRVDGPPGSNIGGPGIDFIQSTDAIIIGQKFTAPIPSPLTVDRATYARSGITGAVDVFATTSPLSNAAPPTPSALSVSGVGITTTAMAGNPAGNFFAHIPTATPNLIPPTVTVTNTSDVPPSAVIANLVDEVTITKANYNVVNQTLSIQASSADKFLNPALTAVGLGALDPVTGLLNVILPAPPASVTVQSSARGTATLPVTTAVNLVPVANNDAATTPSGSATSIFVIANDTDADGFINPATVTIVSPALHGTAVAQPNGTVNYSPNPGYVSVVGVPDTFTYTVQDNLGAVSNIATVSVTVTAAIAPPVANTDSAVTQVGTPVIINVIGNDTAPGGFINPSTVNVVSAPLNGTAIASPNGTVTYTPNPGFIGSNTFSYVVANNLATLSNVATVTVTVTALNAVPAAANDAASTTSGLSVIIPVLTNDTPLAALNPASVLIVTAPANGTATANLDGTVTYTPAVGFAGTNTFTYTVKDTFGTVSNAATVTVTVASSAPPIANNDTAVTPSGVVATINVAANDVASAGNTLTLNSITLSTPSSGSVTTVGAPAGSVIFTPTAGFTGVSTFTYTITDSRGAISNAATVSVTVTTAPTAGPDSATTPSGVPVVINVLANDSAAIGSSLSLGSVVIGTAPAAGNTAVVNPVTGEITYTPAPAFVGPTDTFTYTVKDNLGVISLPATVTVTIAAATTAPVAANDTVIIPVTTASTSINVLANDTAAAGTLIVPATLAISPVTGTGTAVLSVTPGVVTFTPAGAGTSTFTYTVSDNSAIPVTSNVATVTVTVTALPTAVTDAATTPSGIPVTFNVLANDTAAPGNSLNALSVTVTPPSALQGGVTKDNLGNITFTPTAGFTGISTFTYTVSDNLGAVSAPGTVNVTVANGPPVANNDTATATAGGAAVTINVLANDIAAPGNLLNPGSVTPGVVAAAQGTILVNNLTGIITFTPAATFTGTSFTYTVNDNLGVTSNAAIVTVSPTPAVVLPVANNDTVVAQSGIATLFSVVANDTSANSTINPATVTIGTLPLHGTAVANASGIVTYTSTALYTGPDSFTYTVKDLLGVSSNPATVNVTVNAVSPPPTAVADTASTFSGIAVAINVVANDTAAGTINPASVFVITPPLHGTAVAQPNGTVVYNPAPGYASPVGVPDTFTYTVRDNLGVVSNSAIVSVTVNAGIAAIPPTASNDVASTNKNTPVTISVLANDTAAVGHTLAPATVFVVAQPLNGTAAANALGVVTFTPALNFVGTTTFTYNVKDNLGTTSNTATVSVTVLPVNIPPVALNASATMLSGINPNVAIPVAGLVSDIDGTVNLLTLAVVTPPLNGSVTVNTATGTFTYTPAAGFVGVNTFTYRVADNLGAFSNIATVTVTVNAATAETLTITRAFFQLAGSNWRVDGTTSARVVGETVQIFNSATAPAVGTAGLLMTANVDLAGVWTQVAKPGAAPTTAPPRVSIRTSLGNILNNIPVVLR